MSSSSSYSSSNNNPQAVAGAYDVFLSFRGEDTRGSFTSHLNNALVRKGIKPFFDVDDLVRGKAISAGLMKAIQSSRSSVIVLSEHYAFSRWCLTELCKIVECMDNSGLIVLPIFYHVNPSHVRKLIGSCEDAFKNHENNPKLDVEEVETWRVAFKRVGHLAGWTVDKTVNEPRFIEDFIAHVSGMLAIKKKSPHEPAKQSGLQVKEDAVWNQVRKAQHAAGDHPVSATIQYPNSNNNPQKVVAEHDVFLSFRGEDSRSGFTSHLYNALEREGIKTFSHDDNGVLSKTRSRRIMKALRGSRSSIVVFSGHYASSSVCLTELCKIVECMDTSGLIVVPVFYHVNPSDVRKLMGSYKDAFEEHKKNSKLDSVEVKTWRDALKRVANLPGEWTLAKKDAEARFIKDFIAHVSSLLAIGKETAHEPPRQSTSNDANHRNEEYLVMVTVDQKH